MTDMRKTFEEIYARNTWGNGSGEGSHPRHTAGYIAFLQGFLAEHRVRSVVDFGCGDWQFSQLIDWSGIRYTGFDIVRPVVEENQRRFASDNVGFRLIPDGGVELPAADLLIVKDVLQHWSDEAVHAFLPTIRRFPLALITNCANPRGPTVNRPIGDGGFRCLDLRAAPYHRPAEEVFTFAKQQTFWSRLLPGRNWRKRVLLVRGGPA